MTNATTRARNGRRESVISNATASTIVNGRGRKNSVANSIVSANGMVGINGARPRANTISHLDMPQFAQMEGGDGSLTRVHTHNLVFPVPNSGIMPMPGSPMHYDFHAMQHGLAAHPSMHHLPKLDTHMSGMDPNFAHSLHTAPPYAQMHAFDMDHLANPHNTVNPAALHFGGGTAAPAGNIPFGYNLVEASGLAAEGDEFGWMNGWNGQMMPSHDLHEQVIDESSPSRVSSGDSPETYDESLNNSHMGMPIPTNFHWQHDAQAQQQLHQQHHQHQQQHQQQLHPNAFQPDPTRTEFAHPDEQGRTVSPSIHHESAQPSADAFLHPAMMHPNGLPQQSPHQPHAQSQPQPQQQLQLDANTPQPAAFFGAALTQFSSHSPSVTAPSMAGSARHNSVTSVSADPINEATRQAMLANLPPSSTYSPHAQQLQQGGATSSPITTNNTADVAPAPSVEANLTTDDLRRFLDAFIQYALPHLPVVHIHTISFTAFEKGFESCFVQRGPGQAPKFAPSASPLGETGGPRCLLLGMAAVGALYEYDHQASKKLFESAKKLISLYLEARRKADMSAAMNGSADESASPPLWIVQAMFLTVIYGHHCGDKLAADIASNQMAALVSLGRAAHLNVSSGPTFKAENGGDVDMNDAPPPRQTNSLFDRPAQNELEQRWMDWKTHEERKRLFFAIFTISSLLTLAYNQTPCIMNSEIRLDLPCPEALWAAETAEEWQSLGGAELANKTAIPFATALTTLLTANKRQPAQNESPKDPFHIANPLAALQTSGADGSEPDFKPSTFGCYVLIHALHNYIWETRSRHRGRDWTPQEAEVMVSHIEPALKAWQTAWKSTEFHKLERPNPYGLGPMAADSIPLLDMAFVKLFVNLSRTAEAFWRRDFDAMAEELSKGSEVILAGTPGERTNPFEPHANGNTSPKGSPSGVGPRRVMELQASGNHGTSRRERSLRKAAIYAADSMAIACTYNLTYADASAHELPIQSAICFLDCAQVLAEWTTTVQERTGRYLGLIGRDPVNFTQVPAAVLLENEDIELLHKIEQICNSMENKRLQQESLLAMDMQNFNPGVAMQSNFQLAPCGIGSRILRVSAMMLEKAVIWPITHVMAKALETEAHHMDRRHLASLPH